METASAKAVYRLRGQTIELVFADLKEHRGLRRFSGRGFAPARTELALEVLVHNLLVLHRFSSRKQNAKEANATDRTIAAYNRTLGKGGGFAPGEWPPLRHAASARVGSGAAMAGTVTTGHPRLSHCWSSQSVQS